MACEQKGGCRVVHLAVKRFFHRLNRQTIRFIILAQVWLGHGIGYNKLYARRDSCLQCKRFCEENLPSIQDKASLPDGQRGSHHAVFSEQSNNLLPDTLATFRRVKQQIQERAKFVIHDRCKLKLH